MLFHLYEKTILRHPIITLLGIVVLAAVLISHAPSVRIDASSDSLVLEDDDDMRYYHFISSRYQEASFLVITFQPDKDIFSTATLEVLTQLHKDLEAVPLINRVLSIRNVPLLQSPKVPLSKIGDALPSIETQPQIDLEMVRKEFLSSPLYQELLLNKAGNLTALIAYLEKDPALEARLKERNELRNLKYTEGIDAQQEERLAKVQKELQQLRVQRADYEREQIEQVRQILERYRKHADIFLGGVPMIISDILQFIKNDIWVFSIAITVFMILVLSVIFQQLRWVVIPMSNCLLAAAMTFGLLSLLDWHISVISANFVSILLVITMSMSIHVSVFYREQQARMPELSRYELIQRTTRYIVTPCFYMILTTMIAFLSLIVSGIRPVIDFGHIMTAGMFLAFLLTFTFFPALLQIIPRGTSPLTQDFTFRITSWCGRFTERHRFGIVFFSILLVVVSLLGMMRLHVENRFIDYFKPDTEIYRGMLTLDRELGGTTPLDLVLRPQNTAAQDCKPATENCPETNTSEQDPATAARPETQAQPTDDDAFFDDYLDDTIENPAAQTSYWLTPFRLDEIKKIHRYFEARPEIGKVLSVATLIELIEQLNNDKPLNDFEASLLPKLLPESVNNLLLYPYFFTDTDELRFTARILDSDETLRRNELIQSITQDLQNMGYESEQFRLTNMLVLYNNMLQSLFHSQVMTLLAVFLVIMLLFIILFRSFAMAIVGIIPNLASAALVLGIMGWAKIPLDILTITIAAITIGISVDHTIHYVVRFRKEFSKNRNYLKTMHRCHETVGRALYYTSSVIVVGFFILALSNFVPNAYFGLLTGLAMIVALLGALLLLPALILVFNPLGSETTTTAAASA